MFILEAWYWLMAYALDGFCWCLLFFIIFIIFCSVGWVIVKIITLIKEISKGEEK